MKELKCKICDKQYKTIQSLCNHNKRFHNNIISKYIITKKANVITKNADIIPKSSDIIPKNSDIISESLNITPINKYICKFCNKEFNKRQNKWAHEKKFCKIKKNKIINNNPTNLQTNKLDISKKHISYFDETTINQDNKKFKEKLEEKVNYPINNQLINIIIDKSKTIEALRQEIDNKTNTKLSDTTIENITDPPTLIINNCIIFSRNEDNYINATQLCQAGNKQFNEWFQLNTTEQLINEVANESDISTLQLVIKMENDNQSSWIHPDLAVNLAQWISLKFYLQVSKWIRSLFTNIKNISEDHDKEIKLKNQKIQLLEDSFIKKQKRKNYPYKNVIYILTTKDNKKNRIYIIGKAISLKNRLSVYNKTAEHEVVYYKSCNNEENMNLIEVMVLNKLKIYKERANRDRFILPLEKNISSFINIINECVYFIIEPVKVEE